MHLFALNPKQQSMQFVLNPDIIAPYFRVSKQVLFTVIMLIVLNLPCRSNDTIKSSELPPLILSESINSIIDLEPFTGVWITQSEKESWEDVSINWDDRELISVAAIPNYGKFRQSLYTYWLYFKVETKSGISDAPMYLKTKTRGQIDLFQITEGQLIDHVQNGYYVKKNNYDPEILPGNRYLLPIHFEPNQDYELLIRLRSSSTFARKFDLELYSREQALLSINNEHTHFAFSMCFVII
jgi:hypothetical protein